MNMREVAEYRQQIAEQIKTIGRNPDDDLELVTIDEMREWINSHPEVQEEETEEEESLSDVELAEVMADEHLMEAVANCSDEEAAVLYDRYLGLQEDKETGLLYTDFFKYFGAEFVYTHLLAEQCYQDPSKVDWKRVTRGYNHRIIRTLIDCYVNPLVWTGITPDLEMKYIITGDVAQEVHMPSRLFDEKMMIQDHLTHEGALLWFADELPKADHPLLWMHKEPLAGPKDMIVWTYITANYAAMPHKDAENPDYSKVYFAPQNLRYGVEFIAKHRGGKRAAEIVRLLREDWIDIKLQKLFGMELISADQVKEFEITLFEGMDRNLRRWDAEGEQGKAPIQPSPDRAEQQSAEVHYHFYAPVGQVVGKADNVNMNNSNEHE